MIICDQKNCPGKTIPGAYHTAILQAQTLESFSDAELDGRAADFSAADVFVKTYASSRLNTEKLNFGLLVFFHAPQLTRATDFQPAFSFEQPKLDDRLISRHPGIVVGSSIGT